MRPPTIHKPRSSAAGRRAMTITTPTRKRSPSSSRVGPKPTIISSATTAKRWHRSRRLTTAKPRWPISTSSSRRRKCSRLMNGSVSIRTAPSPTGCSSRRTSSWPMPASRTSRRQANISIRASISRPLNERCDPGQTAVGTCPLQAVSSRFPTVHDARPEIRLQHDACRKFQGVATTKRSLPLALAFRPLAELPEQSLLLCRCLSRNTAAVELGPEFVELGLLQQFLRRRKALPSRQFLGEVNFLPFRMSRRLLELGEAGEQRFHELRDTMISIARRLPIVRDENSIDRDSLDRLAFVDQIWIQGLLELGRGIDILKRSRKGDLQEM